MVEGWIINILCWHIFKFLSIQKLIHYIYFANVSEDFSWWTLETHRVRPTGVEFIYFKEFSRTVFEIFLKALEGPVSPVSCIPCMTWTPPYCRTTMGIISLWCMSLVNCGGQEWGFLKLRSLISPKAKLFILKKVSLRLVESHSYLTGANAAELRRHLPNLNMIFNS